jgi:hypothetical protein
MLNEYINISQQIILNIYIDIQLEKMFTLQTKGPLCDLHDHLSEQIFHLIKVLSLLTKGELILSFSTICVHFYVILNHITKRKTCIFD